MISITKGWGRVLPYQGDGIIESKIVDVVKSFLMSESDLLV